MASPLYLELGSTTAHLASFIHNTVVLGHNRHATKGASGDPEGAHPFQHGNITLVHNGSLTTHYSLTTENFTVDSEAICKAISVDGIEAVAPKLRGAFALVWIDSDNNTLNFLRNEERCFAMAWNETTNRMWWASEMDMLKWQLNRDTFTRSPVATTACFELPVGKWISIPITHNSINISARTETELDVSDSVVSYPLYGRGGYNGYQAPKSQSTVVTPLDLESQATGKPLANESVTNFVFGATRENALKKITAGIVSDKGRHNFMIRSFVSSLDMNADAAVLDSRIGLFITNWEAYTAPESKLGTLHGQMMEYPYTKTVIHGVNEAEYDMIYRQSDGMITAYLSGFCTPLNTAITVKEGSLMEQPDLLKFGLILRKDTIREADLNEFYWEMDKMPEADAAVYEKAGAIDANLYFSEQEEDIQLEEDGQAKLELVVSNPEPDSPLRVLPLTDGTQVSPQGTAIFTGNSAVVEAGMRYRVVRIDYITKQDRYALSIKLGQDTYLFDSKHFTTGTLSPEADTDEGPSIVLGPHGEYISVGKWQVAVSKGCCHCHEVPADPADASELVWTSEVFTCHLCYFELANLGYT